MNAVFTIVAKNYFALAKGLANSIREHHEESDVEVIIVIADSVDDVSIFEGTGYKIVLADKIGIPKYKDMSFKYNVTEFCTSVKPFVFSYLFNTNKYSKLIYFDPDILVYNKLDCIFISLDEKSIILTPHFITPEITFTGNSSETLTLFAGIYNLGFLALKNNSVSDKMLKWWEYRLQELCYADKFDALHVDQKWMDFVPAFFPADTLIEHNLGYNIAFWNIHERIFIKLDEGYFVANRLTKDNTTPVIFIHYSGVDPNNIYINKQSTKLDLNKYPDWIPLVEDYAERSNNIGFNSYLNMGYDYSKYSNGDLIIQFHRRLFRRLIDQGLIVDDPFESSDIFYKLLKRNGLLLANKGNLDKMNERNYPDFDSKIRKVNILFKIIKKLIGVERYIILLKFCQRYFRPENQVFLIEEFKKDYKFINENI